MKTSNGFSQNLIKVSRWFPGWEYLVITAIFIVSRLLFWLMGIRFDTSPLNYYYQYIDPVLLKTRLLESLIYMHGQPPLYNLFLGLVLIVFGKYNTFVFYLTYLLMGLGIALLTYAICINLKLPKPLALLLAVGFTISPSAILYENLLIYSLPVAFLLLLSIYLLLCALKSNKLSALAAAFLTLAIVVGIRSSYHYLLVAFLVTYLLLSSAKAIRKNILIGGTIAIIVALIFPLKNYILYRRFETSSWLGMSFWHVTTQTIFPEPRQQMAIAGEISPLSATFSFLKLDAYPPEYWASLDANCLGPAIICDKTKSNGTTNFNHIAYLGISDVFMKDDLYIARHYPVLVIKRIVSGLIHYVWPASSFDHLANNRDNISAWDNFWNIFIYGRIIAPGRADAEDWSKYAYPLLAIWYGLGLIYGLIAAFRSIRIKKEHKFDNLQMVIGFAGLITFYTVAVSNLFEYGENMRFRFEVEPISIILFGCLVFQAWKWATQIWKRLHPEKANG